MALARYLLALLVAALVCAPLRAQNETDMVSQALRQGQFLESKKNYDRALDSYQWADKQAHHTSALCYLRIAAVERKMGRLSDALDDARRAEKLESSDKASAVQAYLLRAAVLVQMSGKTTDKKLNEAEDELHQVLALEPDLAIAHFNLGMILLRQGNDAEGVAELKLYAASPHATRAMFDEVQRIIANPIRAREPFAPDFSFAALEDHSRFTNASLRGKVVLLDFWGSWCAPCRDSVPMLRNLAGKYAGKDFTLLGISSDNDEELVSKFIKKQQMDWPEFVDDSETVIGAFKVETFPTFIVLDKDGVIRFRESGWGSSSQGDLEDAINTALKRPSNPSLAAAYAADSAGAGSGARTESGGTAGAAPKADVPISAIEMAQVEGGVYKNAALGITYPLPAGWTAISSEAIHRTNLRAAPAVRAAIARQHPELPADAEIPVPTYVLYASRLGEGDGQRITIPCVRISARPSEDSELSLEDFQRFTETLPAAGGQILRRPAGEFTIKGHRFLRADLERTSGGMHAFEALVHTLAGNHVLEIEIFANTAFELQKLVDSLETISFSN